MLSAWYLYKTIPIYNHSNKLVNLQLWMPVSAALFYISLDKNELLPFSQSPQ